MKGHALATGEVVGIYTQNPDVAKTLGIKFLDASVAMLQRRPPSPNSALMIYLALAHVTQLFHRRSTTNRDAARSGARD